MLGVAWHMVKLDPCTVLWCTLSMSVSDENAKFSIMDATGAETRHVMVMDLTRVPTSFCPSPWSYQRQ